MSNVLRLAIVDPSDSSREALKKLLLGLDIVWLEAECSRYEFFADVVDQTQPDLGIINIDGDPEKAIQLMERVTEACPSCSLLVVSSSNDGQIILKAMRAGAKEFLTQPVSGEDLVAALHRIGSQQLGATKGKTLAGSVVAVAGATGGAGCTSLAVNLGCAMAANPAHTVALVDLDLALGDADVFLDSIPDYTLADVAQNVTRLDFSLLKRSLTKHSSGLYLLPRPVQLQDCEIVAQEDLQRVFGLLKATFSHLILDLSKGFSSTDMLALGAADHILMVTQLDLPCLRNVVRLMSSLREYEGLEEKVKIVVNRAGMGAQISLKKAQETIGREVYAQIPNDYRTMVDVPQQWRPSADAGPASGHHTSHRPPGEPALRR